MPARQFCTLDFNVRIDNHVGYQAVASGCKHVDGTFFVDICVKRNAEGEVRAFFFKCPSDQRVAMELIPLAEHGNHPIDQQVDTAGFGIIRPCRSTEEEYIWLDCMGLNLYGYPFEYDEYWDER